MQTSVLVLFLHGTATQVVLSMLISIIAIITLHETKPSVYRGEEGARAVDILKQL